LPNIRSVRLCNAACGMMHPMSCHPVVWSGLVLHYQTTGWQFIGCIIPQAAVDSLTLLMMGKIVA
jgi:hypothetical protein